MLNQRLARYTPYALVISAILPALIYLRTLAPTVGERDSFEFQVVSYTLGIAHPTGYPLYLLLGKLFTFIPVGSVAYRVNLLSAVCAVGVVVLLYLITYQITAARLPALVAALTFAVSPIFWSQAVVAEVYTLNALFYAALLYWTFLPLTHKFGKLEIGYLLLGLGLAHHRTIILLAPLLVWKTWRKFADLPICKFAHLQICPFARLLIYLAAPLLLYLYIPIRWARIRPEPITWEQFSAIVFGGQFSEAIRLTALWNDLERYDILARLFRDQFTAGGIVLGVVGILWLLWRNRRAAALTGLAFAPYISFALIYYVSDVAVFAIPAYLIFALWIGAGVVAAQYLMSGALLSYLPGCIALLLPVFLLVTNFAANDRRNDWEMYRWGQEVLQLPLAPNATIIADIEKMAPLHYLQVVEGVRPDTRTILPRDEKQARRKVETRVPAGRPVYLARFIPRLVEYYHLRSLGPLVEVSAQPLTTIPAEAQSTVVAFGHGITLRGKSVATLPDRIRVTLYWQATDKPDNNYEVELQLISAGGQVWLRKRAHPVNGMYPTSGWRVGEVIPDYYELPVDRPIPPGEYVLTLRVSPPFGRAGLKVQGANQDYAVLQPFSVSENAPLLPAIMEQNFTKRKVAVTSEITLRGYDWPKLVRAGKTAPLTLYWQKRRAGATDYDIVLELVDETGKVQHHAVYPFLYGEYPTSRWHAGETWVDTYDLPIPDIGAAKIGWRVGVQTAGEPIVWANDKPYVFSTIRHEIAVQGEQERAVNLGNQVLLLGYHFDRRQVREGAGETMKLTLVWQCLRKMDRDYTVFVQALDDEDKIWGQTDAEPVYGTYPTSQWKEGEIVEDVHELQMHKRAPRERFHVQVGMYHLGTMERLPVLDDEGNPIDDRIYLGRIEVVRNRGE